MYEVSIPAKHSFQRHGARAECSAASRRKPSQPKMQDFPGFQHYGTVAMETWGRALRRDREFGRLGQAVSVDGMRPKNAAADAAAICEATSRPMMNVLRRVAGRVEPVVTRIDGSGKT